MELRQHKRGVAVVLWCCIVLYIVIGSDIARNLCYMEFVEGNQPSKIVSIEAKWKGNVYLFESTDLFQTSVLDIKLQIQQFTDIDPARMRLLGLDTGKVNDEDLLSRYLKKVKKDKLVLSVMGTPEATIQSFQSTAVVQETVLNDFGHNFTPATEEWHKLKQFTDSLEINFIHPPREGCKLLVLDLDHTILDFSSTTTSIDVSKMKRPHMDFFLGKVYEHYDIAIWSQTHWRWVEIKLIELGIVNNPRYRICFALDKASMFRSGAKNKYIKPLHIIWSKFPQYWGQHNTVHVDDLNRNFAMNPDNGLLVSPYYRPDRVRDTSSEACLDDEAVDAELIPLSRYLIEIAKLETLNGVNHTAWRSEGLRLITGGDGHISSPPSAAGAGGNGGGGRSSREEKG